MQTSCRTCRRRRLACDRAKPTCARCETDGHACGGYAREEQNLFVNFDSRNIKARKKRVLCEAITAQNLADSRHESVVQAYTSPSQALLAERPNLLGIQALDLSPAEFTAHFATLWHYFTTVFVRTPDAWAHAYNHLALQSRALDLALIALSAQRISTTKEHAKVGDVACTTYGESVNLLRRLLAHLDDASTEQSGVEMARLAATSLALALVDGCRNTPATIFESGWVSANPHLRGACAITLRAGPDAFTAGGLHLVFKKLREMEILNAMCCYRRSNLASRQWMETPWAAHPKTWRDKLWDIAFEVGDFVVAQHGLEEWVCKWSTQPRAHRVVPTQELLPADVAISSADFDEDDFLQSFTASCNTSETTASPTTIDSTCHENVLHSVDVLVDSLRHWHDHWVAERSRRHQAETEHDKVYLSSEYYALSLIPHLVRLRVVLSIPADLIASLSPAEDYSTIHSHSLCLLNTLRSSLRHPYYKLDESDGGKCLGITEGQCRSLLPAWAISVGEVMLELGGMSAWKPPMALAGESVQSTQILQQLGDELNLQLDLPMDSDASTLFPGDTLSSHNDQICSNNTMSGIR
ncbi:hypothetical protein FH972_022609 [Carpinus fangiana]|uniref:Zn(2)-C6 fungal-type domain-containing protein n=1 Tax=Carpinus fangiana TaxID=176857 RepID=A0A5N6KT95_9ROSI|nr:hypothetical protein FH972_022609 [Carpinus fangiana]